MRERHAYGIVFFWATVMLWTMQALAVTLINRTTGRLLFYDDFETVPAVSLGAYPDASGDYDPGAAAFGAWTLYEVGTTNIQVCSFSGDGKSDPAASPQGTNYLRVVRHTTAGAEASFSPSVLQNTPGDVIHTETMVWIPGAVNAGAFQFQLSGSGGPTDYRANLLIGTASGGVGAVSAWDATLATPNWVDSTLDWLANTWQKWEIDYTVGAETFDLTIDGAKKTLPRSGAAGDVKRIAFRCGSAAANMQFRLDATGYDGSKQGRRTLFRDGFENGTPGSLPAVTIPDIGTYRNAGSGAIVRTGDLSASGGPAAANSGTNYLEMTRLSGLGATLSCLFAGGPVAPNTQELRTRFMLWWGGAGLPGHGLSRASISYFNSTNFLSYNLIRGDASYDAYTGTAYARIAPPGTVPLNTWVPVEVSWKPAAQLSTLRVNGGSSITNVLFGAVPELLDQVHLASGVGTTVYWVDDIEAEWVVDAPPPTQPSPSTGTFLFLN